MVAADPELRVVLVTAPSGDVADAIAHALVGERLAACVNVVPGVRSIYRWEGSIEASAELLLVVKTRADRTAELAARVRELHPYELPEVLELPVVGGAAAYLDWVEKESSR